MLCDCVHMITRPKPTRWVHKSVNIVQLCKRRKTKVKPLTPPGVQFLAPCATQWLILQYIRQLASVALHPIMTSLPSCRIQPLTGAATSGHPITVVHNFIVPSKLSHCIKLYFHQTTLVDRTIRKHIDRETDRRKILHTHSGWNADNHVTMTSFTIAVYGQCCRLHVVGQQVQVVSDIIVVRSCWSICSLCSESVTTPAHWCTWNVYFASNTKHTLPCNMAACTWWPWIQNTG